MTKTKLLFVIESLAAAGAERSLLSLLSALDYSLFDVDLQLWRYGGELERFLPSKVHLLPPFEYVKFVEEHLKRRLSVKNLKMAVARCAYSASIRIGKKTHADKARKYWLTAGKCIPVSTIDYDVAIAYAQGLPTFYVAEKTHAAKKICWVNVSYSLTPRNLLYQTTFYKTFNHIVCVSDSAKTYFDKEFPAFSERTCVMRDRIDVSLIRHLAEDGDVEMDKTIPSILTVARFAPQKGYDIALKACRILKDRGIVFKWYAIGRGPLKQDIEKFVIANGLKDNFIFLGTFANPYPYFKAANIYVQTSRNEGFGLSIAEARVLGIPVVTTEFDAVWQQMVQGKNGLVVPQDPVAVADAIERLLSDQKLYEAIVAYQMNEQNDNLKEIEKFYRLLGAGA